MKEAGNYEVVEVLGAPVAAVTISEAIAIVDARISARQALHIGVVNAAKLVNMRRDEELRTDVLSSDMILADGAAVVWASKLLGRPLPERVTGIDLMFAMFERGKTAGYRVFCLGATEEVSKTVADRIAAQYPGVILAGRHNGYFTSEEEGDIVARIRDSRPDILLVAMTSPKKERFMARWAAELEVPVIHGVGGSFDVFAGKVKRAPAVWQRLGLEWLYRVKQEPGRLWKRYLLTNSQFIGLVLMALLSRR